MKSIPLNDPEDDDGAPTGWPGCWPDDYDEDQVEEARREVRLKSCPYGLDWDAIGGPLRTTGARLDP